MYHGLTNEYLYSAYKIETTFADEIGNTKCGSGTGFFVRNTKDERCLVSNRHVLEISYKCSDHEKYKKYKLFSLEVHGKGKNSETGKPDKIVKLVMNKPQVLFDANQDNDIACIIQPPVCAKSSVNPTIDYFVHLGLLANEANFQSDLQICDFLAFPGYPPWHDVKNMRPILRTGTISSDPSYDYQYKDEVSGECLAYEAFSYGGSSGSPIYAVQKGPKPGDGISFPGFRDLMLVGINAGHLKTAEKTHSGISYMYKSSAIKRLIG